MNIDYETLKNETDVESLHKAIKILNQRLFKCQEELSRAWVYAVTRKSEAGEYGWSAETGELAGSYDLITDQIIEQIHESYREGRHDLYTEQENYIL